MEEIKVAVLIYPGVEVIDMNGPIDVFMKANLYKPNRYRVFTVAESAEVIESENSAVCITPKYTIDTIADSDRPDIIVIPGQIMPKGSSDPFGSGSARMTKWLTEQGQDAGTTIMSVCVGVYFLAKTGLLDGKNATTHWSVIEEIQKQYPGITFIKNVRFVPDGGFITTGGVTSGIDGALYLVEKLDGPKMANDVANVMVYNREAPLPPGTILSKSA